MEDLEEVIGVIGDALCEIAPTLSEVDERAKLILERLRDAGFVVVPSIAVTE